MREQYQRRGNLEIDSSIDNIEYLLGEEISSLFYSNSYLGIQVVYTSMDKKYNIKEINIKGPFS